MNAGALNSPSSYTLYSFTETQALLGSSVPQKACTAVSQNLRNLETCMKKCIFNQTHSHCSKYQSFISVVVFFECWMIIICYINLLNHHLLSGGWMVWDSVLSGVERCFSEWVRPSASITVAALCLKTFCVSLFYLLPYNILNIARN